MIKLCLTVWLMCLQMRIFSINLPDCCIVRPKAVQCGDKVIIPEPVSLFSKNVFISLNYCIQHLLN